MLSEFQQHITKQFPEVFTQRLFVAISGGIDSVVLCFLLHKLKIDFVLGHCNFQLRGQESDDDERFVKNFAQELHLPLEVVRFHTKEYARENGLNTQLAARQLRYAWFEQMAKQHECAYIVTGHHAEDNWETFLINLSRGTGLNGLAGIPMQNANIIRPMLPFSRQQIIAFAKKNALLWREDSSNASDDYTRNRIRHHISPELKTIHPEFLNNFIRTQRILQQTKDFISYQIDEFRQKYFQIKDDAVYFQVQELRHHPHQSFIIFELMKPFQFVNNADLQHFLEAGSGKQLFSPTHRIIQNRDEWIITPLCREIESEHFFITKGTKEINSPIRLKFSEETTPIEIDVHTILVDADRLEYPLQIRKWEISDIFAPFGMQGKKKKVSKFFKDEKYSLLQKEKQWLLTDARNQIIWIIGKRADNRFRITENTSNILKISLITNFDK